MPFCHRRRPREKPLEAKFISTQITRGQIRTEGEGEGMKRIMIEVDWGKHARDAKRERLG